jgi:hypothetical protein
LCCLINFRFPIERIDPEATFGTAGAESSISDEGRPRPAETSQLCRGSSREGLFNDNFVNLKNQPKNNK